MEYKLKLKKAADLSGIYDAFEPQPLREKEELAEFYYALTMESRTGDKYTLRRHPKPKTLPPMARRKPPLKIFKIQPVTPCNQLKFS